MLGDRMATHHARASRGVVATYRGSSLGVTVGWAGITLMSVFNVAPAGALRISFLSCPFCSIDTLLPTETILEQGSLPLREAICLSCDLFRVAVYEWKPKLCHCHKV